MEEDPRERAFLDGGKGLGSPLLGLIDAIDLHGKIPYKLLRLARRDGRSDVTNPAEFLDEREDLIELAFASTSCTAEVCATTADENLVADADFKVHVVVVWESRVVGDEDDAKVVDGREPAVAQLSCHHPHTDVRYPVDAKKDDLAIGVSTRWCWDLKAERMLPESIHPTTCTFRWPVRLDVELLDVLKPLD